MKFIDIMELNSKIVQINYIHFSYYIYEVFMSKTRARLQLISNIHYICNDTKLENIN